MRTRLAPGIGLAVFALTATAAQADGIFKATDLGRDAHSLYLNDSGVVAGQHGGQYKPGVGPTTPDRTAFVYRDGQFQDLGSRVLPLNVKPDGNIVDAYQARGVDSDTGRKGVGEHWSLDRLIAGSDDGAIVGNMSGSYGGYYSGFPSTSRVGYVFSPSREPIVVYPYGNRFDYHETYNGTYSIVGKTATDLEFANVSKAGAVGSWVRHGGNRMALLVTNGSWIHDLGNVPGDDMTRATAINNVGLIAGVSGHAGSDILRAFVSDADNHLIPIGMLPGAKSIQSVKAISDSGFIVGSALMDDGSLHAWMYDPSKQAMEDLNGMMPDTSWILNEATDINESGQIVGVGLLNGEYHGFLLTPQPVPEPSTLIVFAAAGLGLAWARGRARRKAG
ncbi:MAG: PEP-CTERM sorting domain-containing protein [Isosphaeraceae bacterium]